MALSKTKTPGSEAFLPMNREQMQARGWAELDVLLVNGDAYVDHPSFGLALLGRWLEAHGFRVGVLAQPDWRDPESVTAMGRPRLFAGVSAGAVDSMLAHYTAFRKKRHDDAYTPGGAAGARPNRAVSVYTSLLRHAFPGLPVVAGGIEASLRRVSHYDFWSSSLRKSLLADAKMDLLVYGMGERALLEIALRLDALLKELGGQQPDAASIRNALAGISGTARMVGLTEEQVAALRAEGALVLPGHEEILADPANLVKATALLEKQVQQARYPVLQKTDQRYVLVEAPAPVLCGEELDKLYALPFTRLPHPDYDLPIPATDMMLTSLTSHRGCGGGCSFCSLALHQSRRVSSRSRKSLLEEARRVTQMPGFKGQISDVGGPTANMWQAACAFDPAQCGRNSCMFPKICPGFKVDQRNHLELLRTIKALPGVKQVRVASGIRFDLALQQNEALQAYTGEFTGGQLKVAPEHCAEPVLNLMRKPGMEQFERFLAEFYRSSREHGKEQYVVPYLMSAFPGCTDEQMRDMALWLKKRNWSPRQVQCFIPTPGTMATAMFYAGVDEKGRKLYVARSDQERLRQHGALTALLGKRPDKRPASPRPHASGRAQASYTTSRGIKNSKN